MRFLRIILIPFFVLLLFINEPPVYFWDHFSGSDQIIFLQTCFTIARLVAIGTILFAFYRLRRAYQEDINAFLAHAAKRKKRWAAIFSWNLCVLLVGTIAIELAFGEWLVQGKLNHLNIPKNVTINNRQSLYPPFKNNTIKYTRDKYGFRGKYTDPDRIDILAMGGSTTDQRYISDGSTWQDVIGRVLSLPGRNLTVVNAGVDGHTTYGHIKSFDYWFPNIPKFRPKAMLFLVGVNDLFISRQSDYDNLVGSTSLRALIQEKSALYHLFRLAKGMLQARISIKVAHTRTDFSSLKWANHGYLEIPASHLLQQSNRAYAARLNKLCRQVRSVGATPIFVTQHRADYRVVDGNIIGVDYIRSFKGAKYNGVDMHSMMNSVNKTTMEQCRKCEAICIDLAEEIEFEDGDFYDFLHTTPSGSEKIGKVIAQNLLADKKFSDLFPKSVEKNE